MPKSLLIEFLSEEMPAIAQRPAAQSLSNNMQKILRETAIHFAADKIQLFSTPRRIAVLFAEVAELSENRCQEIKGPKQSAPPQAIEGFLKKYGLKDTGGCELRDVNGQATYFYSLQEKGGKTEDLLPDMVRQAIAAQHWQKSMRFASQEFTWVRPLRNILVMFGKQAVKGNLDLGGGEVLNFSDHSFGHPRLHKDKKIKLKTAEDYEAALREHNVIASAEKRQAIIREAIEKLAIEKSASGTIDEKLLAEVTGLVESPSVALGEIQEDFMQLPQEVLITAMAVHQKYFPLFDKAGKPMRYFAFAANLPASPNIVQGNERVLRARLQDAAFLFAEDQKTPLADRVEALKTMNYFHGLGTMHDKVLRLQKLAAYVAKDFGVDENQAQQTATLLKADLMSEMVGEFPELQGIMGARYAALEKYDATVCQAIGSHYGVPNGVPGNAPLSQLMALIDKIDHLAGFWLIGKQPSGSKDPFGLRRAALGIVRIITAEGDGGGGAIALDLQKLFTEALAAYGQKHSADLPGLTGSLVQFCRERYKILLTDDGKAYDILDAVFDAPDEVSDLLELRHKLQALEVFLQNPEAKDATATIKRIANILKSETTFGAVDSSLLSEAAEKSLWQAYEQLFDGDTREYAEILQKLGSLRQKTDEFFDNVMVNDKDKKIRQNRLNLLKAILAEAEKIADFSRLVER